MIRRMAWRNDWHIFRKKDARTGEMIFSLFPEENSYKIYDRDYWWGDEWDPLEHGREYDFSHPFFEQFKELLYSVPIPSHSMNNVVNSHYCGNANFIKNCYFSRGVGYTEDSAYLIWDQASKNCLDSHMTNSCELSYGNVNTISCYKTFFSTDCESCQEMVLCRDCVGCSNCFGSAGLRNKSYCIFNQQYSREEYLKKVAEFNIGSYEKFQKIASASYANWNKYPRKYMHGKQNVAVTGDYIYESKNAKDCYRVRETEDSRFVQNVLSGPVKDCYDYSNWGEGAELVYESLIVGEGSSNIKFCCQCYVNVRNLSYSVFCHSSSDLFGCVSLRKKQYCILNKQYTKEEYEELVPKIIEHMKNTGDYGQFFPVALSPFPYQVTQAHEFFPLTENQAKEKGFLWYDIPKQNYNITLRPEDIADDIREIDENIMNEVIGCSHGGNCEHACTSAFRIIKTELDFLKRMDLPLPRLCPNCRHSERLKFRTPPVLSSRTCDCDKENHGHAAKCLNDFVTAYPKEHEDKIYCESCYNKEVY